MKSAPLRQPTSSIGEFLDFLADALPHGGVYLFGGVLRDLALVGARGFSSDIDMVVDGDWDHCVRYLDSLDAKRNKFGGYRLQVADWSVDIWSAKETWAIRQGLVKYSDISSLTKTTVLNWDAILMDWKTKQFIARPRYLQETTARLMDIVLEQNPNPIGMATRVFRHLCAKDALKVTTSAVRYLARATREFSLEALQAQEIQGYELSIISPPTYRLFELVGLNEVEDIAKSYAIALDAARIEYGQLEM